MVRRGWLIVGEPLLAIQRFSTGGPTETYRRRPMTLVGHWWADSDKPTATCRPLPPLAHQSNAIWVPCPFTAGDMPAGNCPWPHCRRAFVYLYHGHWSAGRLHPASSNWDIADVPYIFRRRNSPDLSAQVQQPSLLNIDLHSTIREKSNGRPHDISRRPV